MRTIKSLNNKRSGFTTFEMIVVLLITSIFFATTLFMFTTIKNNHFQNDEIFWNMFKSYWESTITTSKNFNIDSAVYISNHHVIFENTKNKKSVNIPDNIIPPSEFVIRIKKDGYIAPKTYYWNIKNKSKRYVQKIQMGWGVYRVYEE